MLLGELEHSTLLSSDEEHPEQQPLAGTLDVDFSNQPCSSIPSTKRSCANTNSNRNQNEIDMEAQAETHVEIVEALNSEKNQRILSQFQLTAQVVRRLGWLQSPNERGKKS